MIEWRSASEWVDQGLPGLPTSKFGFIKAADREGWKRRERAGRGGGFEYHYSSLPEQARAAYVLRHAPKPAPAKKAKRSSGYDQEQLWERYTQATLKCREEAQRRHDILLAVEQLRGPDFGKMKAIEAVASQAGVDPSTIRRWYDDVRGVERQDWLAALTPRWAGLAEPKAEIDQRARDWYLTHYLSRRQPTHAETYRRLEEIAKAEGWAIPSARTMIRMVEREVEPLALVLAREGEEAWARRQMRIKRDRSVYAAGEAVSGDGLKFDTLWVRFPDGEIINTATAWVYQDIRTGKVLAHRLGKTENTDIFRLATYDLMAVCAPKIIQIDNTPAASNKVMTAGSSRYRFKNNEHDGLGLLPALGIDVHRTGPDEITGNPGAKPIERAFGIGGIHSKVASHPRFAGRGFSKATAIGSDELREVLDQEIARHNAQKGRRTDACRGQLSFDEAWEEATRSITFRKFTERQRNMLLMSREPVRIDHTGVVAIKAGQSAYGKNRYWSEATARLAGKRVVALFDPDNLHAGIDVYSLTGEYLCTAEYQPGVAFNDTQKARELSKFRRQAKKASDKELAALKRMSELEHAEIYAKATSPLPDDPAPAERGNVVAASFIRPIDPERDALRGTGTDGAGIVTPLTPLPEEDTNQFAENFARNVRALHERFRKEQL
ncbi:transposase domain-containing protein [Paracoccus sp. P2]|uniref:transposase domain-containing protein n=1 Tax=Paracoccus sp. P2 TaxID=3248840 RepID=UPI00391F71CD